MDRIVKFFRDYSFARFFVPVGVLLIVFSIIFFNIHVTRKNYPQTNAVVSGMELYEEAYYDPNTETEHEATYRIFVKYTVNGTEYEEELGTLPEMKVGETVRIDYNPSDPRDISQPTSVIVPMAIFAAGFAALAAGIVSILKTHKKNKRLKLQEEAWKNGN